MKTKKKTIFHIIGGRLTKYFPYLKMDLDVAEIDKAPSEFLGDSLRQAILVAVFVWFTSVIMSLILESDMLLYLSIPIALIILILFFFLSVSSPKTKIKEKVRDIENNLPYAVKSIRIHLTSGATLFEVFLSVAKENYGRLSETFKKAVKEINMGRPVVEVLEEMTERVPSIYFKNAMWPLIGGLKTGGDLVSIMDEVSISLSKQQVNQSTAYGSKIQSISMLIIVLVIVGPCIAMIGTVIASSFMGMTEGAIKLIFNMIIVYFMMMSLILMVLINANKPSLVKR
ncbi:MAG: type II secretion system F family protein [Candidatus Woesearchaeota archaeon]